MMQNEHRQGDGNGNDKSGGGTTFKVPGGANLVWDEEKLPIYSAVRPVCRPTEDININNIMG